MRCMATSTPPSTTPTSPASNVSSYASTRSTPLSSGTNFPDCHRLAAWPSTRIFLPLGWPPPPELSFDHLYMQWGSQSGKAKDRRLRSTKIIVAEETKVFVKPNEPNQTCSGYAMARKRALKRTVGGWAQCELWQQTILESTALVATTEGLDGNTRFSARLHNYLTVNKLPRQERI